MARTHTLAELIATLEEHGGDVGTLSHYADAVGRIALGCTEEAKVARWHLLTLMRLGENVRNAVFPYAYELDQDAHADSALHLAISEVNIKALPERTLALMENLRAHSV